MKYEACLPQLERLTSIRPTYADIWHEYCVLLSLVGQNEAALAAANHALQLNPQYGDASVSRAFVLAQLGRQAAGFRGLRSLHTRNPDGFHTLFALGIYCLRNGWKDVGLEQLLRAESFCPKLPYLLLHLAAAFDEVGESARAQERLAEAGAIVEALDNPLLRGCVPDNLGALSDLHSWRDPYECKVHVLYANMKSCEGDLPAAEDELLQACRRLPGHVLIFSHAARALVARGKRAEAMMLLTALLRMDPGCPEAHMELSFLLVEAGEWEVALRMLRKAVMLRPLYPDYHFHLGQLLWERGRKEEAVEVFHRVMTIHPSYGHTPIYLANAYLERNAAADAVEVLESSPCRDWPEALILAAQAHIRLGDVSEARASLDRALALDSDNSEARQLLASIEKGPQETVAEA